MRTDKQSIRLWAIAMWWNLCASGFLYVCTFPAARLDNPRIFWILLAGAIVDYIVATYCNMKKVELEHALEEIEREGGRSLSAEDTIRMALDQAARDLMYGYSFGRCDICGANTQEAKDERCRMDCKIYFGKNHPPIAYYVNNSLFVATDLQGNRIDSSQWTGL